MKKILKLNIATYLSIMGLSFVAYYLLVIDNCLHSSISSIIGHANGLEIKMHALVLGLLPIYIALVVFGTGILGMYIGNFCQTYLSRRFLLNDNYPRKTRLRKDLFSL